MARFRQTVFVGVSLAGPQDTAVVAHRPGTDGAAVSVRIGAALLYLQDSGTARGFHDAWRAAARQARDLPMLGTPSTMLPTSGRAEPAVMMESSDSPAAWARWEPRKRRLRVTLGRLVFDVGDHEALRSTLNAFRRADELAARTFRPPLLESALEHASHTAGRLFAVPSSSRPSRPRADGQRPVPRPSSASAPAARSAIARAQR